jgi:hypothetical protein
MKKQTRNIVKTFANEAEEAEWWYKNRSVHGKQLLTTVKSGDAQVLPNERLRERLATLKKKLDC